MLAARDGISIYSIAGEFYTGHVLLQALLIMVRLVVGCIVEDFSDCNDLCLTIVYNSY